jgi:hypothetical protein
LTLVVFVEPEEKKFVFDIAEVVVYFVVAECIDPDVVVVVVPDFEAVVVVVDE